MKSFKTTEERKIVIGSKGIESVYLTLLVECSKEDFARSVERTAKVLLDADLRDVKEISIQLKATD